MPQRRQVNFLKVQAVDPPLGVNRIGCVSYGDWLVGLRSPVRDRNLWKPSVPNSDSGEQSRGGVRRVPADGHHCPISSPIGFPVLRVDPRPIR